MRGIGILFILIGLGAIGLKVLAEYAGIDLHQYFVIAWDMAHGMATKYGTYGDYGVRGAVLILGIIFLLISPGSDE